MKLYFDGSHANNKTGYGFVITRSQNREVVAEGASRIPTSTSNVAEYSAICSGILEAEKHLLPNEPLQILGDSQLVIKQIEGEYKIRAHHLIGFHKLASERIAKLREAGHPVTLKWIRRSTNSYADRLAGSTTA